MRIIILTSNVQDIASRVLPTLCLSKKISVAKVVLAHGGTNDRGKKVKHITGKIRKIGLLGALNGLRLREWYADKDAEDIIKICSSLNIEISETPALNSDITREIFSAANADLGLSLGNGYIPKSIFSIPKYGMLNIHMELLPDFRGAQGIIWPIYEGKKETGYTIHQIDKKIDTGDILFQERYPIKFCPVLRETVETNLKIARSKIPEAFVYVCENYELLKAKKVSQSNGNSYTTPSILQFFKIIMNHRKMYRNSVSNFSEKAATLIF